MMIIRIMLIKMTVKLSKIRRFAEGSDKGIHSESSINILSKDTSSSLIRVSFQNIGPKLKLKYTDKAKRDSTFF